MTTRQPSIDAGLDRSRDPMATRRNRARCRPDSESRPPRPGAQRNDRAFSVTLRHGAGVYRRRRRVVAVSGAIVVALTVVGLWNVLSGPVGSISSAPLSAPMLLAPWAWCAVSLLRWSGGSGRRPASPAAAAEPTVLLVAAA